MSKALLLPHQITLTPSNSLGQLGVVSIQPPVFFFRNRWGTYSLDQAPCESGSWSILKTMFFRSANYPYSPPVGVAVIGSKVGDRMPYLNIEEHFTSWLP
jgi:hypothetical protein